MPALSGGVDEDVTEHTSDTRATGKISEAELATSYEIVR
jgi:hypothetical protein